jgi:hypothetical protein
MVLDIKLLRLIAADSKIEGRPILRPHKYLKINRGDDVVVHDFIIIKYDYIMDKAYFVMSVDDVDEAGLLICGINITDFENASLPILYMKDYKCQ